MRRLAVAVGAMLLVSAVLTTSEAAQSPSEQAGSSKPAPVPEEMDRLLAPIALYPDQLIAQILLCAADPAGVTALSQFLKTNSTLKGTELQDAAVRDNFEPSFVALAPFGQIVDMMASKLDWTTELGQAFAANRSAVFDSIQRLRAQAQKVGSLKTTEQQEVTTQMTSGGQEVIVIEPANPQVVYVPQYNATTVYTTPATTNTTVVVQDSNSSDAAIAGVIGFTAGIAIGAAIDNDYYYGPYGWHGGAYMYNDAWDDYYDAREDAREDWMDHREDIVEERGDRAEDRQEQVSERRENTGEQRTDRQENRQENRPESQAQREQRRTDAQARATEARSSGTSTQARSSGSTYGTRGYTDSGRTNSAQRGSGSDAFSGYSSGKSERAASSRGQRSRGSSRSGGGGGRRR